MAIIKKQLTEFVEASKTGHTDFEKGEGLSASEANELLLANEFKLDCVRDGFGYLCTDCLLKFNLEATLFCRGCGWWQRDIEERTKPVHFHANTFAFWSCAKEVDNHRAC